MRKLKQRLFSLLLCAALAVSLCPTALAGGAGEANVPYLDENGAKQTCPSATLETEDSDRRWGTGWYVTSDGVEISECITVTGDVHLILANNCGLKADGGIEINSQGSNSLTIYAQSVNENMGALVAAGGSDRAGIQCGTDQTLTINGGKVEATGSRGAGIGGGNGGAGGTITISGGTVTATGSNGAGVGGGMNSEGGEITINGGTVTATSGNMGAGIGGGDSGASGNFTANGNAFITASRIDDQSGKNNGSWSGVIFEGTEDGKVYGGEITLAADAEIPAKRTLEVGEGQILTIGKDVTLTNSGEITNAGTIINNGTITGSGTIINNGTIKGKPVDSSVVIHSGKAEWSSDDGGHWHPCTVAGCTAHKFDTDAHTPGDWVIDKAATSTEAGHRHKACTVCGYTMQTETIPATGGGDGGGSGGGGGSSYIPPTTPAYPPTVEKPSQGGGVSVSPSNPKRGDTVTVTPEPDEGYEVDEIIVTDKDGKSVEVTVKPDGTYTFTQPAGKVTVVVTYKPVNTPWSNPFADVSEGDWYYEAVRFVQERGLMNGYEDGRFGPNDVLPRAHLAQILFNKEGKPVVNYLMDFADIAGEAWYAEAVRWAASQGIVGDYGNGAFGPDDPITREQLAVMFWRYSGSSAAASKELHFSDESEVSPFALEALCWAAENGILNGCGDGRLGPQWQVTRAQVAQMLKNFIENQEENT